MQNKLECMRDKLFISTLAPIRKECLNEQANCLGYVGPKNFTTCRCLIAVRPIIAAMLVRFSLEGYAHAYEAQTLGVMGEGCTSGTRLEFESILRKLIG